MKPIHDIILPLLLLAAVSCGNRNAPTAFDTVCYSPEYAEGFEILGMKGSQSRVIRVRQPWQEAGTAVFDLFIARDGEKPPAGFEGQVLYGDAARIAAMSSSHIAMLDLIDEKERIKAVSGIRFISDSFVQSHRDSIIDVGNEADADFEALAASGPDLVLLYGINSASAMENRLRQLGIPYLYIGEYMEKNPLGRTEWVIALAEAAGCGEKGERAFRQVEKRYNALKASVPSGSARPQVMLNTPYGDKWFMASPKSAMAAMIHDAGGEYIFKDDTGTSATVRSSAISFEEAFVLVSKADFWLNTGQFTSLSRLAAAYPVFSNAQCVRKGNVYSCDKRSTEGGGSDFWESGAVRPDLVLKDLISIFHPGTSMEDSLYYYRKLE